jgi:Uma2 family endonuclease
VLIDSRTVHVEVYRRSGAGHWSFDEYGPGDEIILESIGFQTPIEALYEDLNLTKIERIVVE